MREIVNNQTITELNTVTEVFSECHEDTEDKVTKPDSHWEDEAGGQDGGGRCQRRLLKWNHQQNAFTLLYLRKSFANLLTIGLNKANGKQCKFQ